MEQVTRGDGANADSERREFNASDVEENTHHPDSRGRHLKTVQFPHQSDGGDCFHGLDRQGQIPHVPRDKVGKSRQKEGRGDVNRSLPAQCHKERDERSQIAATSCEEDKKRSCCQRATINDEWRWRRRCARRASAPTAKKASLFMLTYPTLLQD